ncbi:putative 5-formyltetrahydrofolate cyclo-ligase [Paramyrothecium foliicola]|nr:putative 5-formyltetrahydrofolate cyclo-ligase [Paramyrothecium foliicola]
MTQSDMAAPLKAAKQHMRALMKQKLAGVSQESVLSQSRKVFEALKDFPPYQNAQRVSIYLSMPAAEIQTDALVRHALESGKHVFVPYLHKSPFQTLDTPARVMDMVQLKDIQDYEGLARDRWGIPSVDPATVGERRRVLGEPDSERTDESSLDLILMPGVAFDADESGSIRRLGHGKGFYDFFINRYLSQPQSKDAKHQGHLQLYGLALTEQLFPTTSTEQIPTGPHDRRLDGVILGDGQVMGGLSTDVKP